MELDHGTRQELLNLERRYWSAVQEKDATAATELSDDPCIVVGAQGVGEVSKDELGGLLDSATYELERFDMEDVHVRKLSDGVVALAYKVKESLVVDGEDVSLEAFDSSVWVRRNGEWMCALHTESLAGDPFGRR
ncbi:MAG: nuclear transport factor 2 family protein [Dehalococcoidia bacterium]